MAMVHRRPLAQQVAFPGLVEHYMSRIWLLDGEINAVVESCAPPTAILSHRDHRLLEGLPFLVKDTEDLRGFHTTCGSSQYEANLPADDDSKLVALLRHLGAVPIGKTNVPFLAQDVQTFNEVYGLTRNPHNRELSAGGSSGGSAAAVAAGLAAFATGSDWNGSLRVPAAFCGVSSLRASRGRMTGYGSDRISPPLPADPRQTGSVMATGIIAKTVADVKFVMDALFPLLPVQVERIHLAPTGSFRIGVWTSFSGVPLDDRIKCSMDAIPSRLEASGGTKKVTACWTPGPPLQISSLHKALQAFTQGWHPPNKPKSQKFQQILDEATSVQNKGGDIIDTFLSQAGFEALITPVCAILPHEHNLEHLPFLVNKVAAPYWRALTGYVAPFSVTGNPVVTMPLCVIDGRPLGIQVVGRRQCDEDLLRVSAILEDQLGPITNQPSYL